MKVLIEECKSLFARYDVLDSLDICTYCCVNAEHEGLLRRSPRFEIPLGAIYEYNASAKSGYTLETLNELKYFTPRILELVSRHKEVHHSNELYLDRFALAPVEGWLPEEIDFFDRFAVALINEQLQYTGVRHGEILIRTLIMLHDLPIDIAAHLPILLQSKNKATMLWLHDVYLHEINWRKSKLTNSFSKNKISSSIISFLSAESTLAQIGAAIEYLVWAEEIELSKSEENKFDILHTIINGLKEK